MKENKEYTPAHSYDEVMRAIMKLPEDKKDIILTSLDIAKIVTALDSEKNFAKTIDACDKYINCWAMVRDALNELYNLVNITESATDNVMSDYDMLDASQKKETALRLLNNGEFQRDCCEILITDMERVVANDSTLKGLDNLFGLTKYFKKFLQLGIGADHQYRMK